MKHLGDFSYFDWNAFAKDKVFRVISCNPWKDSNTQRMLGTKVECVILEDNTQYILKNGETSVTNAFEKLTFKIAGDTLKDFPEGSIVSAIDAKGTIYGDYRNQLSVRCSDLMVLAPGNKASETKTETSKK